MAGSNIDLSPGIYIVIRYSYGTLATLEEPRRSTRPPARAARTSSGEDKLERRVAMLRINLSLKRLLQGSSLY